MAACGIRHEVSHSVDDVVTVYDDGLFKVGLVGKYLACRRRCGERHGNTPIAELRHGFFDYNTSLYGDRNPPRIFGLDAAVKQKAISKYTLAQRQIIVYLEKLDPA